MFKLQSGYVHICRRYKTGYVWQDSLDEDLITPISDNEYVIKGSEFCSATSDNYDGIFHFNSGFYAIFWSGKNIII